MAVIYLSELGYRVLQATNAKKAMTFLQDSVKIDLFFSDIVMPGGKDGLELSEAALKLRPELKVLFVSGYAPEDDSLSENMKHLLAVRLSKPYSRAELAQRVRLLLDGKEEK